MTPIIYTPSILKSTHFTNNGYVIEKDQILVPAYIASQLGFNYSGNYFLDNYFYPELKHNGIFPLCPFKACSEFLDLKRLEDNDSVKSHLDFWSDFNDLVGRVNYEQLMPRSKIMIAILDGGPAVDDGVASEIAYFNEMFGPVFGIKSDARLGENISAPINPATAYFMSNHSKGKIFAGPNAYQDSLNFFREYSRDLINQKIRL